MTPSLTLSRPLPATLAASLADALTRADDGLVALADARPVDRRDRFLTLLSVYDLHTAPLEVVGDAVRHQGHPAVAAIKARLEREWLDELEQAWAGAGSLAAATTPGQAVQAMRAVAARDRLPAAYRWLATDAARDELVEFLSLEGGPDGGFDDLVAVCQVGLAGSAKLELGKNYWDEMGCGDADAVHTVLHRRMVDALGMRTVGREEMSEAALERACLGGLFVTNRWLQPEMIGALGLLELQAGPRCRLVLQAFDRLGVPAAAYPFYAEHADVDPIHGRDWVDKAVAPLTAEHPDWGPRIVKGAWWRSTLNLAFFEDLRQQLVGQRAAA